MANGLQIAPFCFPGKLVLRGIEAERPSAMTTWTVEELTRIGEADELNLQVLGYRAVFAGRIGSSKIGA